MKRRILWVDDEIDLLKAHIIYLEKRGYELIPTTNGQDAIALIKNQTFDAVLLDEMMPGMDGLSVLDEIKTLDPGLPVVMITKSEEEQIMDNALGSRISDYLIKPVNPSQIFTTLKRLFDTGTLRSERISREYTRQVAQNRLTIMNGPDYHEWTVIFENLCRWDFEIDEQNDAGLRLIHTDQKKEARREFCRYVERTYRSWIDGDSNSPLLSHQVLDKALLPRLNAGNKVYFILIDCFRLDHWLAIEPKLEKLFHVERSQYYSILPSATPFSRNALFAGMLPRDIARKYPDIWQNAGHDEYGMNRYERDLIDQYLKRNGIIFPKEAPFEKILRNDDAHSLYKRLPQFADHRLVTIVYNFIDLLSHQRSENDLLMEITPDESAFRSLTRAWFDHSILFDIMTFIAAEGATLILTTDHGSIMTERTSLVRGDRSTSTNIRYKYGRNLKCNQSEVFMVQEPEHYGLPSLGLGTNYLFAKEDYYLVYQNNYRQYEKLYQQTFQHGGISMEEMILPLVVMTPR
jgi:CheY-like chemotaxis protein